jgi:hypothetical protein
MPLSIDSPAQVLFSRLFISNYYHLALYGEQKGLSWSILTKDLDLPMSSSYISLAPWLLRIDRLLSVIEPFRVGR